MRVVFWDAKSKSPVQSLSLKPKQPTKIAWSPSGRAILVLSKSGSVVFLAIRKRPDGKDEWFTTQERLQVGETEAEFVDCIWNHCGNVIVAGEKSGLLTYYTYPELRRGSATGAHSSGATCLALDPRGKYIATSGADSIVNLFDVRSWRVANTLDCTEDQVNGLDFSYDGEFMAVAFSSCLEIWATEIGECIHRITQQITPCRTVAWHPWKLALVYGGQSHQDSGVRAQPQVATLSFFGV